MSHTNWLRLALVLVFSADVALAGILAAPRSADAATCDTYTCWTLTVLPVGNGSGTWQSTNSTWAPNNKISCTYLNGAVTAGSVCSGTYADVLRVGYVDMYYVATPTTGSEACTGGSGGYCDDLPIGATYRLTSSTSIGVTFRLLSYAVGVSRTGNGAGSVFSTPSGIVCGQDCAENFTYGTPLLLIANAAPGSYFDHWTGACLGQGATCHLDVTGSVDTTATFVLGSPPTPSPPAATPVVTPAMTPKATVKPTSTPRVTVTPTTAPATAGPGATPGPVATEATSTDEVSASTPAASQTAETPEASRTPGQTELPIVTAGGSVDFTPIVVAILGAGLLIALGIGFGAFLLRRRTAPPSS